MDSNQREREPLRQQSLTVRPLALARPARFEPPQIADPRAVNDAHARQMVDQARIEGLHLARAEVNAAVAQHTAAARELQRAAEVLLAAASQLMSRDREDLADIEEHAIRFGVELAEHLVGRELRSCDEVVQTAIARAMTFAPDRGTVMLRVNPLDRQGAQSGVAECPDLQGRVELVPDSSIEPGGCIAVVGPLRIDAQLGTAMQRVRAAVEA